MTAPTFQPGDEIEWKDEDDITPRWRAGRIVYVRYEIATDADSGLLSLPGCMIRSAPRLPLEGIDQ